MEKNTPLFIGKVDSAPRPDAPLVERDAVVVIVRDPKTKRYLTLTWKEDGRETFVTGGREGGKSALEAALAEVREETGYVNLVLVSSLPSYEAKFYHPQKGVNRHAYFRCLLLELINDEQIPVSKKESALHKYAWLPLDEIRSTFTEEGPLFLLDYIVKEGL